METQTFMNPAGGRMMRSLQNDENISHLPYWPIQLKLIPEESPAFNGTDLLIAADCTAYAYADFGKAFTKNKTLIITCPKLNDDNAMEKLTNILKNNDVHSVTIIRMSVPCCQRLEKTVEQAVATSQKMLPVKTCVITPNGSVQ